MEVIMKKVLVTGGTIFVSRYIAEYYVAKGYEVYVLNRNSREQSKGVKLIQADRHNLGEVLRSFCFDVVIDTAYNSDDINKLLDALGNYKDYILVSSSAVYPEYATQPFNESMSWAKISIGENMELIKLMQKKLCFVEVQMHIYFVHLICMDR